MGIEVIPKSRLTAFERWEMGSFDPPARTPRQAPAEGVDAAAVQLPTAAELERIHQEAHKAGYAAGYEEGTARVRMEAMRLHTMVENLDQALRTLDQSVADSLLDLAMELAQQMVRHELQWKPSAILDVVQEVLQQIFHPHATIHLHPEDAALVRAAIGEQLNHAGHRVFEDPKLTRGGCRVEAGGSQIDASMETRWRRIAETMGRPGAKLENAP